MLKSRIRAVSRRIGGRRISGRRVGKKAVALALAPIGVAAVSFAGLAIAAPGAYASTGCVTRTFDIVLDENTYQPCVLDMQVLLNNLYNKHVVGPNQELATDGYFGIDTANDVVEFNLWWNDVPGQLGEMTPTSWDALCGLNWDNGFHGTYWHNAGCATEPGL
jgi:hypothetical protein